MFSNRTNWNFLENKLTLLLKSLKRERVSILDLTESNPTHCHFKYLDANLLSPLSSSANLAYEPSPNGKQEARQAIQKYYAEKGIQIDEAQIFLTASTSEAYSHLFRLLTNAGEKILIPKPSYPLFHFIADLNDTQLDHYSLNYQNNRWQVDSDQLLGSVTSVHKAMIAVHPNNPTGSFLKTGEAKKLIKLASEKSLAIISDEVFSDYGFAEDPERWKSFADTKEVLSFTLGGISKCLGLPQMKISWIIVNGPKGLMNHAMERLEMILDTYLSVGTPSQAAIPYWFSQRNKIQSEIRERIVKNYASLEKIFLNSGVSCLKIEGGWYGILKLPDFKTEEEIVLELLEKDHVLVHPGYFFDCEEGIYLVLSLLPESNSFQEGCERILQRLKQTAKASSQLI